MSRKPGQDKIAALLQAAELQRVAPDAGLARLLLEDAGRALRKSAASLLEAQVLRATSRGGHIAIQEVAQAQFGASVRSFRSFGRIRRARNNFEYPRIDSPGPSADDVGDAITIATRSTRRSSDNSRQGRTHALVAQRAWIRACGITNAAW